MDSKVVGGKRKNSDIPVCKYGLSCYQKNAEHRKKFKHPSGKGLIDSYFKVNSSKDVPAVNTSQESVAGAEETTTVKSDVDVPDFATDDPIDDEDESPEITSDSDDGAFEETVDEILKSMPKDFFHFWKFCSFLNKSKPQDAFSEFGYKLVGVFDLLAKKFSKDKKIDISCHWRYFYDPPEFQTVIKKDGKDLYHIGYFRDDPSEMPSILASNSAALGPKLTLVGDNIFCAMNAELSKILKAENSSNKKAAEIQKKLLKFASEKKYPINVQTSQTKARQKKVVAQTFHRLGIVVPVKNDVGHRPLPDSDSVIKNALKKIVTAENETKRLQYEEYLDDLISNVHFANDECDYGMGLEFGIDLFCYGDPYLHKTILAFLTLAYNLLERPKYASIVKSHLKNRKKGSKLSTLV